MQRRLAEATRRADDAEQRLSALINANVIGITISDGERIVEANDAFLELTGYTREELAGGISRVAMTPPEWADADARALEELRERGAAAAYEKEFLHRDGRRMPVLVAAALVSTEPFVVLGTVHDLADRKAVEAEIGLLLDRERDARFAAELASARMGRLQEITAGLSASNTLGEIARVVVHHALEDLSASAGLLALDHGGRVSLAHAIGFSPDEVAVWKRFPMEMPATVAQAMEMTGMEIAEGAVAESGGLMVGVPLLAGRGSLGAIGIAFREPRELTAEDRDFLGALGRQAAAALERALLFENRAYVAQKLQEGLLPAQLDDIPGMESAVRYTSITGGGEVGGDFYDLFAVGGDRWTLAIGDVCGKGTEAAVITGLARHTVRAVAALRESPAEILRFLNDALRRNSAVPAFCTVEVAIIEPGERGGFRVRAASGGHPGPLILRADGSIELFEVSGTMLGAAADPEFTDEHATLHAGDALVAYTDGVVDARPPGGELFGEERLRQALESAHGLSADAIAQVIEDAVREHQPHAPADDRAILVVRATG